MCVGRIEEVSDEKYVGSARLLLCVRSPYSNYAIPPLSGSEVIRPFLRKSQWSLDLVRVEVQIKPLGQFFPLTATRLFFLKQDQK